MYLKQIRAKDLGEALTQTKRLFHAFWNTSLTYKLMYHIVIIYLCIRYQYCLLIINNKICLGFSALACGLWALSNSDVVYNGDSKLHTLVSTNLQSVSKVTTWNCVDFCMYFSGFLNTGHSTAQGNQALMDILAVLQWVQDNIRAFNGDPNKVTLFGHGHGAALVNILTFSSLTEQGTPLSITATTSWPSVDLINNIKFFVIFI